MSTRAEGRAFGGGASLMFRNRMPADRLKALIGTVHSHECYISTGGFIERVISVSGGDKAAIITYLEECKKIGFDVLETSSGFLTIPTDDWANLVKLTKSIGDTVGLESIGTRDPKWLIELIAGISVIAAVTHCQIESEGITENVKHLRTDVVSSITSALPVDKLMFEAVRADGFPILQTVQLACVRKGIWGKTDLFNRVVTFKDD
ncbi:hypothetical protein M407DRAFT_13943 [Tulasnella calospora MUT 4182]|uniref:Uncharacterized protein n=1 Tax=Tulasnella calospora MUT 4182 TaxID=1051891 RepID=A0A0C3LEQ0_9AGAM|nr:hypothetical protein M407DRAFT_13943 [Tulasnella calospora MUT 4182]